ncbi:ester cyclase [Pseudomonas chlororaphis]|nr:ester cyclase [Pseudomonas chlororaphis]
MHPITWPLENDRAPPFADLPVGALPAASGRQVRFTGTSVFQIEHGKIVEEIGKEGALLALQQLDFLAKPNESYTKLYEADKKFA